MLRNVLAALAIPVFLFATPPVGYTCTTPPCLATGAVVCTSESKTVPLATTVVLLNVIVTDTSTSGGLPVCPNFATVTALVTETDGFNDATSISFLGPLSGPAPLAPLSSISDILMVTFPAIAPAGLRTFDITITGAGCPVAVACQAKISLNGELEVEELFGNQCALAGTVNQKVFRIKNQTPVPRTATVTVTSTQTSSAPGTGDHYPLVFCGNPLGPGNPANPIPASVTGVFNVPAGVGSFVDVCIDTRSFPACQEGSNCHYELVATDAGTGNNVFAGSDLTVIIPGWGGWGIPATSVVRAGSCPNPVTLSAPGPVIGTLWVASYTPAPGALIDLLMVDLTGLMIDVPTPFGCILCRIPTNPALILFAPPGAPTQFTLGVPNDPTLVGLALCVQAGSITGVGPLLIQMANALDMTIGNV